MKDLIRRWVSMKGKGKRIRVRSWRRGLVGYSASYLSISILQHFERFIGIRETSGDKPAVRQIFPVSHDLRSR